MKIAVMGSAPSSAHMAPSNDPNWEIWCCSPPNYMQPRVDAWFELHNLDRKFSDARNGLYYQVLQQHPRVYTYEKDPRLPQSIVFPWKDYVAEYGTDFFTSSIAWMMAHAISYKPEKIGLWGVDMSAHSEYDQQRPGVKFFMREAKLRGIDVYVPETSDIQIPNAPYAIREHWPMWAKLKARRKELNDKHAKHQREFEEAKAGLQALEGAMGDLTYIENTWIQPPWITETIHVDPQQNPHKDGPRPSGEDSEER